MDRSTGIEPHASSSNHEKSQPAAVFEDGILAGIVGAVVVAV